MSVSAAPTASAMRSPSPWLVLALRSSSRSGRLLMKRRTRSGLPWNPPSASTTARAAKRWLSPSFVATKDGESHRFAARAVVLADGGFQGNPDLVRRFISKRPERLLERNAKTGRGDGLLMAEAVGAALTDMNCFYGHVQARDAMDDPELWPYPTIDFPIAAGIAVDASGRRFTDEGLAGVAIANAIARLEDPLGAVAIFDETIWELSGKTYVMSANPFLVQTGATFYRGESLDAVAAQAGLPRETVAATVARYNDAVEAGTLDRLDPPRSADFGHIWGSKALPI